ncbi:hypothetical protein Y919_06530 [Caloranaerobacter azorensis H53214]|uniref:Hemerythrin n=2 Tax=Caloranaerobacter azorensis TaxID=116090 RepID=A0A1M5VIP6_9FIRM|nr:bacteriohemerythrin [Caloranaerobacter azorensis]KGG80367.1 hypothetical protein Y919_06530 [Caloranaerobacter azorensis H53214]SHH75058.1 hemerythrin [Caloranaerobacter azorensis DSM 13643]
MFKWKEEFSTKVDIFDEEHKKLFEIGNRLYDLIKLDDEIDRYDEIMGVISEMADYAKYHFKHEEELMHKYGYPPREFFKHVSEHKAFFMEVEKMMNKDIDVEQREVSMHLVTFLVDWISNHILKTDMKYADFFADKDI